MGSFWARRRKSAETPTRITTVDDLDIAPNKGLYPRVRRALKQGRLPIGALARVLSVTPTELLLTLRQMKTVSRYGNGTVEEPYVWGLTEGNNGTS